MRIHRKWLGVGLLTVTVGTLAAQEKMLIGTSDGAIRVATLRADGKLAMRKFAGMGPLMFLAFHPRDQLVYAAVGKGVTSFYFDGVQVRPIAHRVLGMRVTHVEVDRRGRFLYAASYGGNAVLAMPLNAKGVPGAASMTLTTPDSMTTKAHQVRMHPTLDFVYAPCLGDDAVQVLAVSREGDDSKSPAADRDKWAVRRVDQATTGPGSGPRHLDFHPDCRTLYVLNELTSWIYAYRIDPKTGSLDEIQRLRALPDDHKGGSGSSDIHVSADGRFVYAVHREPLNEIVTLSVGEDRKLNLLDRQPTGGRHSRSFAISADGRFLVLGHSRSKDVVVHRRDPETGFLGGIVSRQMVDSAAVFVGFVPDKTPVYGYYDVSRLLASLTPKSAGLPVDFSETDSVLRDLETHVILQAPEIRSADERSRARRDATRLASVIRALARLSSADSPKASKYDPLATWMRVARLEAVCHRLEVQGSLGRAKAAFEVALRKAPDDAEVCFRFATLLVSIPGGAARALPLAENAKRLGQRGADRILGVAHFELGDRKKAIAHLEMHCKAAPSDRKSRALLASWRSGQGAAKKRP